MKQHPELNLEKLRKDAHLIFQSGLKAVDPIAAVKRFIKRQGDRLTIDNQEYDLSKVRNCFIIGAGKASAAMAQAVESILKDHISTGIIVVKYGHDAPLNRVQLYEAAHPVPDDSGLKGAKAILSLLENTKKNDLVICLSKGSLFMTNRKQLKFYYPAVPPFTR
jgi:glycerate 2-kinase